MNRYIYTRHNPLKYVDPTGNLEEFPAVEEAAHKVSDYGVALSTIGVGMAVVGTMAGQPEVVEGGCGLAEGGGKLSVASDAVALAAVRNGQNLQTLAADAVGARVAKGVAKFGATVIKEGAMMGVKAAKMAVKAIEKGAEVLASSVLAGASVKPESPPSQGTTKERPLIITTKEAEETPIMTTPEKK